MRILIATDAFPPVAGGSGWSTYELARGLRERGHSLLVVQPYSDRPPASYDGFDVIGFHVASPGVPFVRNYFRNERLYRRLGVFLAGLIGEQQIDLVHAQHELTGPAAVRAARAASVPSVCTVRDYWPLCYWSDLMIEPATGGICSGCSAGAMTHCLRPRVGPAWPLATSFIPYMRRNLDLKQRALADADAIIAVSAQVAAYLRGRSPILATAPVVTIPNGVDIARVRALVRASSRPMEEPYALFIGKLATNKGAAGLVNIATRAALDMPLVIIGDGPERSRLLEAARKSNRRVRVLEWLDRDEVFRWLGHASMLVFPSNWPEPLSRVLLEASALGVPIAAMNTGGTADVAVDDVTALLSGSVEELTRDVARLGADAKLRTRLGAAAARRAEERFEISVVTTQVERLYADVIAAYGRPRPTANRAV